MTVAVGQSYIMSEMKEIVGPKYVWDTPHEFYIFTRKGEYICLDTAGVLAVEPEEIPLAVAKLTLDSVRNGSNPYLLAVKTEGYKVTDLREDRGPDYAEQLDRDRVGRNFKNRPDSVETVSVWAVDRNFRLWVVEKARGSSTVSETYYPMGVRQLTGGNVMETLHEIIERINNVPGMSNTSDIFWVQEEF